jgi:hypothetical protein
MKVHHMFLTARLLSDPLTITRVTDARRQLSFPLLRFELENGCVGEGDPLRRGDFVEHTAHIAPKGSVDLSEVQRARVSESRAMGGKNEPQIVSSAYQQA